MVNRLKVMELVRYEINTNLTAQQQRAIQESNNSTEDTVSAVFATGFSLIASQLGQSMYLWIREEVAAPSWFLTTSNGFQSFFHSFFEGIIVFTLFAVFFFGSFSAFRIILKRFKERQYAKKSAPATRTLAEYKKIMNDFDHIACDAILFTQYFIEAYRTDNDKQTALLNSDRKTTPEYSIYVERCRFDVYEAIYYLKKAELLTYDVFIHGDHCINSQKTVDRIAVHRLENMILLMEAMINELDKMVEEVKNSMSPISSTSLKHDYEYVTKLTIDLRNRLNLLLTTPVIN